MLIKKVDSGNNRWTDNIIKLTTDSLSTEAIYTLTVTGIKEFGGHYFLDTTANFTFNGWVEKITCIAPQDYDADDDGKVQPVRKFAITFNVPMKADDDVYTINDHIIIDPYYSQFINQNSIWLNPNSRYTLITTGVYEENTYIGYSDSYFVDIDNTTLNVAENKLKYVIGKTIYPQNPYLDVSSYKINSSLQFTVTLNLASAVDSTATNSINYTLRDSNNASGNTLKIISADLNSTGTVITITLDNSIPMTSYKYYYLTINNVHRKNIDFPAEEGWGIVLNNYSIYSGNIPK